MEFLKGIFITYLMIAVLFLPFIIGKVLIDYTFTMGVISDFLLAPFTIMVSLAPSVLILIFAERLK